MIICGMVSDIRINSESISKISRHPLWKIVLYVLIKLNIPLSYEPTILLIGIYPRGIKMCSHTKNCIKGIYSSCTHNCPKLETTKMFFNR